MMSGDLIDFWLKESTCRQVLIIDINTKKIITCNEEANDFLGVTLEGMSLKELATKNTSPTIQAGLLFCLYIQNKCLRENKNMLSLEHFNGSSYLSFRFIIRYKSRRCLLLEIQKVSCDCMSVNKIQII